MGFGFSYKLTTPVRCRAFAAQPTFLADTLASLLAQAAGQAVVCFADAARPAHNTRSTRA